MNSNLQNKLQQFSADPPERVWNKIADALDTETSFSRRLYQYEETPPVAVWQAIEQSFNEIPEPAKVIPFTTRFRKPLRYTAVACFIAVILVTITLTFKRTEAGSIQAGSNTTVPTLETTTTTVDQKKENKNTDYPQTKEPVKQRLESEKERIVRHNTEAINRSTQANKSFASSKRTSGSVSESPAINVSSLGGFIMLKDGNGKLMKISKKLATLVNCKDGDGSCQQRLQQLRQKMAAKAMTTDFTGVIEMLTQLQ